MLASEYRQADPLQDNRLVIQQVNIKQFRGSFCFDAGASSSGSILLILCGAGTLHGSQDTISFRQNDAVILGRAICAAVDAEYVELIQIDLNKSELLAGFPPGGHPIVYPTGDHPAILAYFKEILQEYIGKRAHYETIADHLLQSAMLYIMRDLGIDVFKEAQLSDQSLINSVKTYFEKNYAESISIDSLANSFYVSKSYLSHTFKQQIGISPINYLISVRITTAQRLLATTDLSIQEISEKVGYVNSNYFSLLFKKLTTKSPTEFRLGARRRV